MALVAVLALAACGGGKTSGDIVVTPDAIPDGVQVVVDTAVSPTSVETGGSVTVTCTVTAGGQTVGATTEVVVSPEGATVDGLIVTFTKSGTFEVACTAPELGITDDTPATVTVARGKPTTIDTVVDPTTAEAGADVAVQCVGKDADGKGIEIDAKVVVQPAATQVTGEGDAFTLVATAAGNYQVACASLDGTVSDPTPVTLTIVPGPVAKVKTELADDTIVAGGSTTATCTAYDAHGNTVAGVSLYVGVPEDSGLTVAGGTVTGTKAGLWDVTCTPTEASAAELEAAALTVEAGEAAGLTLFLIPAKAAYRVGEVVKVGFNLVDGYGNKVPGGEITQPVVDPDEGMELTTTGGYKFLREGSWVFSACVVGQPEWCDDLEAWCDGTAPELVIDFPERGATLDGSRRIYVTGHVSDTVSAVGALTINGAAVPIDANGAFSHPVDANLGMNLIEAVAADTFGNTHRTVQSFLFSFDWHPQNTGIPAESAVANAVRAYLDDKLFYNADASDEGTLSAILEMVVKELDIATLLPSPVTQFEYGMIGTTCGYDLYIPKLTYGEPNVKVSTVEGGLNIVIEIPQFYVELDMKRFSGNWQCLGDQKGNATADKVKVTIRVAIAVDPATKQFNISTVGGTLVEMENLKLNLDSFFLDLVASILTGTIEDVLRDQVAGLLTDQINGLDDTINEALAEPIEIPIGPLLPDSSQVVLRLTLVPEVSEFKPDGGRLELSMAVTSDRTIDRQILGSMGRAGCLAGQPEDFQFNVTDPAKMQIAAHEDVISELLFAFWNNGGLNLHVTGATLAEMGTDLSTYGITDLDLTTYALIPPVVTSCNPDDTLTIQVGDLYLETAMGLFGRPTDVHFFLFLEVQAVLSVVDDPEKGRALSIQVLPPTLKDMDIVYANDEWAGEEDSFKDLILNGLLDVVFNELKDPFVVAIPAFNLKDLAGEPEPGEVALTLPDKDLVIYPETVDQILGFTYIEADLKVQDPAPEEQ
jgi:hypothetical protein